MSWAHPNNITTAPEVGELCEVRWVLQRLAGVLAAPWTGKQNPYIFIAGELSRRLYIIPYF